MSNPTQPPLDITTYVRVPIPGQYNAETKAADMTLEEARELQAALGQKLPTRRRVGKARPEVKKGG